MTTDTEETYKRRGSRGQRPFRNTSEACTRALCLSRVSPLHVELGGCRALRARAARFKSQAELEAQQQEEQNNNNVNDVNIDADGNIIDENGNIIDENGEIIKRKISKAELEAQFQEALKKKSYVLKEKAMVSESELKQKAMENILKLVSIQDLSNLGKE